MMSYDERTEQGCPAAGDEKAEAEGQEMLNGIKAAKGFTANGLTGNGLKIIAMITMLIDHTAVALPMPDFFVYGLMRFIGRIAAPILFFFVAEGYHHTGNKNKYLLRLAAFAVISYLPFIWFMTGGLPNSNNYLILNVIYTLFIGFLALRAKREISRQWLKTLTVFLLFLLSLPGDWSYLAVIYILAFDYYRGDFKKQAYAYTIITFISVAQDFLHPIAGLLDGQPLIAESLAVGIINLGRFLPIGLLYLYNGQKGSGGKWAQWGFYIFYPLHLILLCLVRILLNGN